jgi:hypothetical protein
MIIVFFIHNGLKVWLDALTRGKIPKNNFKNLKFEKKLKMKLTRGKIPKNNFLFALCSVLECADINFGGLQLGPILRLRVTAPAL